MGATDADSHAFSIEVTSAEALVPLRHAILRPTLTVEDARFPGDLEATTIHLAAIVRGRVLGCASFMAVPFEGRDAYQLRGMATDPAIRGAGAGAALLVVGDRMVRARGVGLLWCNARCSAIGFYEKQGWTVVSTVFDIPVAGPHVRMTKALA